MEIENVFFVITTRRLSIYYFNVALPDLYGQSSKQDMYPPTSVANIFENWLYGINLRFKMLIKVRVIVIIWSF
jgi:hypothetical protein